MAGNLDANNGSGHRLTDSLHLHIVFPTFNNERNAVELLNRLLGQTFREFSIYVVDHGTRRIDLSAIEDNRVNLIKGSPDIWWTGTINLGLRAALEHAEPCDIVLTLNDDVIIDENYLESIVQAVARNPETLIGSVCINESNNKVRYADLSWNKVRGSFPSEWLNRSTSDLPKNGTFPCDVLSGRGMAVPCHIFKEIGLFDEARLPHYAADYEFAWRAREAGYRVVCATNVRVKTRDIRRPDPLRKGFLKHLVEPKNPGNLPTARAFSRKCFSSRDAAWYMGIMFLRACSSYFLAYVRKWK